MRRGPFQDHGKEPREFPTEGLERLDGDLRIVLGVAGVEVGRSVVVEVHTNGDAEEHAYGRHSVAPVIGQGVIARIPAAVKPFLGARTTPERPGTRKPQCRNHLVPEWIITMP